MNLQSHTFVSGPLDAPIKALPLGMGLAGAPEHVAEPNQPLVRMLEKRRLQCYLVMMLGDIAALALGFVIASIVRNFDPFGGEAMRQARMITPIFLTIALYNGSYSIAALGSLNTSLKRAAQALLLSAGIVLLIAFFMKTGGVYSRMTFGVGVIAAGLALCASRRLLSHFAILHCGGRVENVLIVEDGGPRVSIPGAYAISASEQGLRPDIRDPLALDRLGRWFAPMDRVVISCAPRNRVAWSMTLKGLSVEGEIIDETVWELGALGARNAGGQGLLLVSHRPLDLRQRAVKRAFDLAIALPALVVLAPLLLVIAIAIRLQDGGPALFVQKRSGRGNRIFSIYKFRSMRIERQDAAGALSAVPDDERFTPLGKLLRRTSIDELPQLLNVVRGEMSLVGPRPHALASRAGDKLFWDIDQRYAQRHCLKPGLTGLAQVRGFRGATDTEADLVNRLHFDLQYLDGWSAWRDLGILLATTRVMVHSRAF